MRRRRFVDVCNRRAARGGQPIGAFLGESGKYRQNESQGEQGSASHDGNYAFLTVQTSNLHFRVAARPKRGGFPGSRWRSAMQNGPGAETAAMTPLHGGNRLESPEATNATAELLPATARPMPMEELSSSPADVRRQREFKQSLTDEIASGIEKRLRDQGLLEPQKQVVGPTR